MSAKVTSYPPFPGKERHLLRAQLARIEHATDICPKDTYVQGEDEGWVLNADAPATDNETLKSLENWTHARKMIYKNGRCSHITKPGLDEEEAAAEQAANEAEQVP